jgi:hypothetical protein
MEEDPGQARRDLQDAVELHLPAAAVQHIDRCTVILSRAMAGNPIWVVESYDSDFQPLKAYIGTSDGQSVEIRVRYEDGRSHREVWTDGRGEIVDGHRYEPTLWAGGLD